MEKTFSKARGSRSNYEANETAISAFSSGFFKGLNLPLSLSIPEIKRKKRKLRIRASDWANIKGDMKRAMKYVIRTDR